MTYRETDDVGEQGGDGRHDEDRVEADRVRVARGALQVGRELRDERRGMSDLADDLQFSSASGMREDGARKARQGGTRQGQLTSSASGVWTRLCSSRARMDWKSADEIATPPTWPSPRKSWPNPVPTAIASSMYAAR